MSLLLLLAFGQPALAQQAGGTLTVALTYDVDTLNVYSTGFSGDVQAAVVEGLLAPDANAHYVPVLAREVPTLDNGGIELIDAGQRMRITYHLRPGVKWSDGVDFTSEDVKFTWESLKNPDFLAESKEGVEEVERIDTPDPLTVVVTYKRPTPNFASTLFTFGIFPKHTLAGKNLNKDPYNDKPLGTGPFMVTAFKRGQYVICDRNPYYWRHDEQGRQLPYLDRIIFKFIPDTNTLLTQLRVGEVMLATRLPYAQSLQLRTMGTLELRENPTLSWYHLDFNFRGPAPLRDLRVRQAFAHAINKQAIVKALGGLPKPIKSPIVPLIDLYDPATPDYAYDPAAANRILDEAGYARGGDGIRAKDGQRLSFAFVGESGRIEEQIMQQIIAAYLKTVGIELHIDNKAGVAFREARYKGNYDVLFAQWITSPDPDYAIFFGSKGPNNGMGYSNPTLDALFAEIARTLDQDVRKRKAAEAQAILATDLPTIPLTTNPLLIGMTKRLQNFVPNPTNMTNFVDTSRWWLLPPPE